MSYSDYPECNMIINNEGYNLSFVFLHIFSLIFLILIMLCVYKYFKTERLSDKSKKEDSTNLRPCISQKNGKLIIDD